MSRTRLLPALLAVLSFLAFVALTRVFAVNQPADTPLPKVSTYAPIDDLANRVDFYVKRIDSALANQAEYGDEQKKRVAEDGSTVAVLAMAIGVSDQENKLKASAAVLQGAAEELADVSSDYAAAQTKFTQLKAAMDSKLESGPVEWRKIGHLESLMEQTEVVLQSLKSGVNDDRRFKRQAADTAAGAATVAVIAQEVAFDPHNAKVPGDAEVWRKFAAEMRDAAGELNGAVHAGDQAKAKTALERVGKSCEACHAVFNKEDK